jgi:hypothetical protein
VCYLSPCSRAPEIDPTETFPAEFRGRICSAVRPYTHPGTSDRNPTNSGFSIF